MNLYQLIAINIFVFWQVFPSQAGSDSEKVPPAVECSPDKDQITTADLFWIKNLAEENFPVMRSNFDNETPCSSSEPCPSSFCKNQKSTFPKSLKVIPCCVRVSNPSKFVCQCVRPAVDPDGETGTSCPSTDLVLISNQQMSASGETFLDHFNIVTCTRMFNSWNVYLGKGQHQDFEQGFILPNSTEELFILRMPAFGAQQFGKFYIQWYAEVVVDPPSVNCNSHPKVDIILNTKAVKQLAGNNGPVFKQLKDKASGTCTNAPPVIKNEDHQCPTKTGCNDKNLQCCYSSNCMFGFSRPDDCPCPPKNGKLLLADRAVTCDSKTVNNQLYVFKQSKKDCCDGQKELVFNFFFVSKAKVLGNIMFMLPINGGTDVEKDNKLWLYWFANMEITEEKERLQQLFEKFNI